MSKIIKLTRGLETIVSDEDYGYLSKFKWYVSVTRNARYAVREINRKGIRKILYMHRIIMGAEGQEMDHIDGNGLNNQRENLRFVEHYQNLRNQQAQEGRSSIYKGVYLDRKTQTWVVQIKDRSRVRTVYGIEDERIAAYIYDLLALDRFKEFARFNFPEAIIEWNRRQLCQTKKSKTK